MVRIIRAASSKQPSSTDEPYTNLFVLPQFDPTMIREYSKLTKEEEKFCHPIIGIPRYIIDPIRCVLKPGVPVE